MAYRYQLLRQYTSKWLLSEMSVIAYQSKDFHMLLLDESRAHPTWRLLPLSQHYVRSCEKEVCVDTLPVLSEWNPSTAARKFRTMEEKLRWCWYISSHHENRSNWILPQYQLRICVPTQVLVGLWIRMSYRMVWINIQKRELGRRWERKKRDVIRVSALFVSFFQFNSNRTG